MPLPNFIAEMIHGPFRCQQRMKAMKRHTSPDALIAECGEPDHRIDNDQLSIWHYPLGVRNGMLHSIHVAVFDGKVSQVYLHFEPAA